MLLPSKLLTNTYMFLPFVNDAGLVKSYTSGRGNRGVGRWAPQGMGGGGGDQTAVAERDAGFFSELVY